MAPLLTEFVFIIIIAAMLLLLACLNTIAKYAARRRLRKTEARATPPYTPAGTKIIPLPQNTIKPAKERFLVKDHASEEEIV